ncbi:MAG: zinc dependent phospholipase C family protein [bacterium]|nr:zinc dependent phospholipase C family protein [bacterium]
MPSILIHEQVAYELSRKYKQLHTKDFYLGSLAPDAVNLAGFAPKEERWQSHIRHQDLNIWLENVKDFYYVNQTKYNKYFLLGYILHIITDIIYDKYFYNATIQKIAQDNIKKENQHQALRKAMEEYDQENASSDFWLEIKHLLTQATGYDIRNITKEDLFLWKNKCLTLKNTNTNSNKYITKEQILALTNKVEEEFKIFI